MSTSNTNAAIQASSRGRKSPFYFYPPLADPPGRSRRMKNIFIRKKLELFWQPDKFEG
jgi:hypothetical protein